MSDLPTDAELLAFVEEMLPAQRATAVEQLLRRNEPRRPDPADAGGVPVLPGSLGAATAGDR